jgi:hypothetical protein
MDMPIRDFDFCRIFVELFRFEISKNRLPAINDSGESKIEPEEIFFYDTPLSTDSDSPLQMMRGIGTLDSPY